MAKKTKAQLEAENASLRAKLAVLQGGELEGSAEVLLQLRRALARTYVVQVSADAPDDEIVRALREVVSKAETASSLQEDLDAANARIEALTMHVEEPGEIEDLVELSELVTRDLKRRGVLPSGTALIPEVISAYRMQ